MVSGQTVLGSARASRAVGALSRQRILSLSLLAEWSGPSTGFRRRE